jgi:ABC-type phosphate transport system auxiliary subunit
MTANYSIGEIEARCWEIQNSPYMRKEPPGELQKLKSLLGKVDKLTREDVPILIAEIKRLRAQNKRLEANAEAHEVHEAVVAE